MSLTAVNTSLRLRGMWPSLAVLLAFSSPLLADEAPGPQKAPSLAAAQMVFRGADTATVGQRFTLEVLIVNAGSAPLEDLEFHAQLDPNLEQPSKTREHRAAIAAIAPDDLQIVRLTLTPRKAGPGGLEITLRGKNGAKQQFSYVLPIAAAYPDLPPPARAEGVSPLKIKIAALKECFAGQSGIVLVNVLNTDSKPMPGKLDLVVSYGTMGLDNQLHTNPQIQPAVEKAPHSGKIARFVPAASSNPTRQTLVTLPALEPGESHTIPVRLTPRRIGELGIAITAKGTDAPVLGTARLSVGFDPKMSHARLLPTRTGASAVVPTRLPQTLAEVPEVALEDAHTKTMPADEAFEHVAHLIEKIKHVNKTKTDAYMEALIQHRADVRGLPFTLGEACRLNPERGRHFLGELVTLRGALTNRADIVSRLPNPAAQPADDNALKGRVAALVQVVEPEGPQLTRQMVKYLASLSHVDATRALAKMAVVADDDQVRQDAVAALALRRDKDVSDILLAGLSYPWPAVAQRSAEAIAKLKRQDLAPKLLAMLEGADPRAPQLREQDGKQVTVVRELVKINHLRNCLLCHSPASVTPNSGAPFHGVPHRGGIAPVEHDGKRMHVTTGALTAPVPLPKQQLPAPSPSGGYGQFTIPDVLVSFDVTYLRQDFSVMLPVTDAKPWPEQQRFDFLVRTRELSAKDAQSYRELFQTAAGELSPYQRAAVAALRQLTGRDAEPTAAAWRQVLAEMNKTK